MTKLYRYNVDSVYHGDDDLVCFAENKQEALEKFKRKLTNPSWYFGTYGDNKGRGKDKAQNISLKDIDELDDECYYGCGGDD